MKLRTKFSIFASLLVIIIIFGVSIFLFVSEKQYLVSQIKENQITIVNGLTQISKESLITNDQILLLNYIKIIMRTKSVNYVIFTDSTGKILAHTNIDLLGETDQTITALKTQQATELINQLYQDAQNKWISEFALPILDNQKKIGILRIGFSQDIINKTIQETVNNTAKRIFNIAVIALLIGILGSLILSQTLTKPLKKLTEGAELIGKGKLNTFIEINNTDELGKLAKEFNIMAYKLKELDQMKQDFTSSVTHELRSPLTSILMYIDLFLKGVPGQITEKQKEFLTIIKNSATRLNIFINDLLDVAKIERGKMEIINEPLNLKAVFAETLQLFIVQAEKKDIKMNALISDPLPIIMADQNKIRQVLNNLLSNAIKFTPNNGQINIEINDLPEYLQLKISDTGIGIPPADLNKIFDKFEQVKSTRENINGPKGTGLGLAIVKAIIEMHHGKIWVESKLGKGTSFYFTLPKHNL